MSELVPTISLSDFKRLKSQQLKQLKSCVVTSDGEYLFTFINAQTDYIKAQAEYMGEMSNTIGGKTLEEVAEIHATV